MLIRVCLLQAWLRRNNIQYGENFLKAELLALVKRYKSDPRYRIDQVTSEQNTRYCAYHPTIVTWTQLNWFGHSWSAMLLQIMLHSNDQMFNSLLKGHLRPSLPNDGGPCVSMWRRLKLTTGRETICARAKLRSLLTILKKIHQAKKIDHFLSCHLLNKNKRKNKEKI